MFSKPLNCLPPSSAKVARATLEPLLPGPCSIRILRSSGMRGGGAFFFITSIMWPRHFYPSHWQCFRPICFQIIFAFWLCSITTLSMMQYQNGWWKYDKSYGKSVLGWRVLKRYISCPFLADICFCCLWSISCKKYFLNFKYCHKYCQHCKYCTLFSLIL